MEPNPKFTNSARYKCLEHLKKQSVDLFLCYCGIEECDSGHSYGPTERTEYLLHYVVKGTGIYELNGTTYHLKAGQAFLICPGVTTYYKADQTNPWTYAWVGFNGIKAKTYLKYAGLAEDNLIGTYDADTELVLSHIHNMLNSSKLTYANELRREGYLFMLLSTLIDAQHNTSIVSNNHDYPYEIYVEHALEFIEHNYEKNIKVQDIADYIGINRSYLTSSFKKSLTISPQEYLVNYRLDKAAHLLRTTNHSINVISTRVGYDDPLTFSKVFKRFKGVSPKVYRSTEDIITEASSKYDTK